MNRKAGNFDAVFQCCAMYVYPVKSFAAKTRNQRRMDIDDPIRKRADEISRYHGKIAGQDNKIDTAALNLHDNVFKHRLGRTIILLIPHDVFDPVFFSPFNCEYTLFRGHQKSYFTKMFPLVRIDDRLKIAARSACENRYFFHSNDTPFPLTVFPMRYASSPVDFNAANAEDTSF